MMKKERKGIAMVYTNLTTPDLLTGLKITLLAHSWRFRGLNYGVNIVCAYVHDGLFLQDSIYASVMIYAQIC